MTDKEQQEFIIIVDEALGLAAKSVTQKTYAMSELFANHSRLPYDFLYENVDTIGTTTDDLAEYVANYLLDDFTL